MAGISASRRLGPADRLAVVLATALGCGFAPLAPGTVGSGFAVFLYLLLRGFRLHPVAINPLLLFTAALTVIGVWASTRATVWFGEKDPGKIVIDEVAGQFITFIVASLLHPLAPAARPILMTLWIAACFLLFRVFDVVKPFPIRRLENLPSGLGVMADDLLAGTYAGIVVSLLWKLGAFMI